MMATLLVFATIPAKGSTGWPASRNWRGGPRASRRAHAMTEKVWIYRYICIHICIYIHARQDMRACLYHAYKHAQTDV